MSEVSSLWWTDERIEATLCRQYVFSHLHPQHQPRLFEPLPWGEGLTSETYLEWILTKAGKLFLILSEIGVPQRIFNFANDFVDDSDLPFAEARVPDLPLTRHDDDLPSSALPPSTTSNTSNPAAVNTAASLHHKFFLTQWRYIVRGIAEGEHVRYTENEGVPVEVLKSNMAMTPGSSKDGVEKVVLSGAPCRVLLRTQVSINAAPYFSEEDEVLEEIRSLRQLAHEHVLSVYGSYTVDNSINVLFSGVYDRSLMSFLSDMPQSFKRLPKPDRREMLVNWPHCLVSALAWLHANGHAHGSIRPSNVLVDSDYRIFLGHFESLDTLLDSPKINDIEAYQYAAPERWIRTTAIQETNSAKNSFHSGGRTVRLPSGSSSTSSSSASSRGSQFTARSSWTTAPSSQSSESRGTVIRLGSRNSLVSSSSSSADSGSAGSAKFGSGNNNRGNKRSAAKLFRTKPIIYTPSIHSSNLASDSRTRPVTAPESAANIPFVPHNTALVRTWQSQQVDAQLSDIFSLGAVITDIFTVLCERKISSFATHRSAKNRTPGRGGGVADASFHLVTNLPQVSSWLTLLTQDSKKRKGLAFRAVEPMLDVVRDMMARSPDRRPSAEDVEARFAHTIRQLEGILVAHCKQVPISSTTAAVSTSIDARSTPSDMPLPPSQGLPPHQSRVSSRVTDIPEEEDLDDDDDDNNNNLCNPNSARPLIDKRQRQDKRATAKNPYRGPPRRLNLDVPDFDFGFSALRRDKDDRSRRSPTTSASAASSPTTTTPTTASPTESTTSETSASLHQRQIEHQRLQYERMLLAKLQEQQQQQQQTDRNHQVRHRHHHHHRHQDAIDMKASTDDKRIKNKPGEKKKKEWSKHKDRTDTDDETIDETIARLRKALEVKLNQAERVSDSDSDSDDDDDSDNDSDSDDNEEEEEEEEEETSRHNLGNNSRQQLRTKYLHELGLNLTGSSVTLPR